MRKIRLATLLIILAVFAASALLYGKMPGLMASHWDLSGQPNGYMEKGVALFFLPVVLLAIAAFLYLIPLIDPMRENIEKFQLQYDGFVFVLVLFLAYVHWLTIGWNLGYYFDMNRMMVPGLGVLFIYIGFMFRDCKQNWFVGVRTPWTLSSERVWGKTHYLAEKMFIGLGILWIALGILMPQISFVMIIAVLLSALFLFVYSYWEFRQEQKEKRADPQVKAEAPPLTREVEWPPEEQMEGMPAAPAVKKKPIPIAPAVRLRKPIPVSRPMPKRKPLPIPFKKKPSRRPKKPKLGAKGKKKK